MTRGARKDPKRLRNAKSLEDKLRWYDLDGQVRQNQFFIGGNYHGNYHMVNGWLMVVNGWLMDG